MHNTGGTKKGWSRLKRIRIRNSDKRPAIVTSGLVWLQSK